MAPRTWSIEPEPAGVEAVSDDVGTVYVRMNEDHWEAADGTIYSWPALLSEAGRLTETAEPEDD